MIPRRLRVRDTPQVGSNMRADQMKLKMSPKMNRLSSMARQYRRGSHWSLFLPQRLLVEESGNELLASPM